jgi:hypothetical protein
MRRSALIVAIVRILEVIFLLVVRLIRLFVDLVESIV